MAADQVHEILVAKAQRHYHDLAKAFRSIDKNGNGVIQKKELRDLLFTYMLPMTKEEFSILWNRYDLEGKGYIDHRHFLKMMGRSFAPSDNDGMSRRIVEESMDTIENHHKTQLEKQINITLNQANKSTFISTAHLEQSLKDRMRDKYGTFQEAFAKLDQSKSGFISVKDLQKILLDHNYLVDNTTLKELLHRLGLPTDKSRLSYENFLNAFDEGMEAQYRQKGMADVDVESFGHLKADKASKKLRKMVQANVSVLQAAFGAFDKEKRGRIGPSEFRRVLDNFCFKLTGKQFKFLLTKVKVNEDLSINYPAFLDDFSANEQELAQNWIESFQNKEMQAAEGQEIEPPTSEDIMNELQRCVSANLKYFEERFTALDYASIGVVPKDDFRDVLASVAFNLTNDQFDALWDVLPANEFDNLQYRSFLDQCGESGSPLEDEGITPLRRPASVQPLQVPVRPATTTPRAMSRSSLFSGRRGVTPLVNAESTEQRLKRAVIKYWHEIQKLCRLLDPENTGEVEPQEFAEILENFNILLPAEEFHRLALKYDLKESGKFAYTEFLKHFVLNLRPIREAEEPRGLLSRQKIHAAKVPVGIGSVVSSNMVEAMLRVKQCVEDNWKRMRRVFRNVDTSASGIVSTTQFRQILRQFNINLSEDEFFHLMTYYDKDLADKISYNDFLRAFLQ
ncbi:putative EF-hand calcium-binding domain-containing protein 6 [Apostichopus japonicus]|uniref:Putative EF-hand calcium-binding domain-containing protein 6 n=1 Tax=Stichopus japonicus TaxID=307972 RepID=A0A2G8KT59_STIJA|nr:putative EF-hand calcium-binding domain-containing protein 6 [Apostichopus japonicus]